jgi:hypothetical protein
MWYDKKWNNGESNPRPPECESGALPTELLSQIEVGRYKPYVSLYNYEAKS